jgi:hypothetical protein
MITTIPRETTIFDIIPYKIEYIKKRIALICIAATLKIIILHTVFTEI